MSATTNPETTPSADGRDSNGRFARGNKIGTGNPFAREVAQLRKEMFAMLKEGPYFRQLVEKLMTSAIEGDWVAARLLLQYVLGRPAEAVDPDRLEIEEWKILQEQSQQYQSMNELINAPRMDLPLVLVNASRQAHEKNMAGMWGEMDAKEEEEARKKEEQKRKREERKRQKAGASGSVAAPGPQGSPVSAKQQAPEKAENVGVPAPSCPEDESLLKDRHQPSPSANGKFHHHPPSANGADGDCDYLMKQQQVLLLMDSLAALMNAAKRRE